MASSFAFRLNHVLREPMPKNLGLLAEHVSNALRWVDSNGVVRRSNHDGIATGCYRKAESIPRCAVRACELGVKSGSCLPPALRLDVLVNRALPIAIDGGVR